MNRKQSLYGLLVIIGFLLSTALTFIGMAEPPIVPGFRFILGAAGFCLGLSFYFLYLCCASGDVEKHTDEDAKVK